MTPLAGLDDHAGMYRLGGEKEADGVADAEIWPDSMDIE
jgi:hypothetical protein